MAGRIPQNFIDDLLARIDIVDLIDSYVPLRKAGKNHQACCPFHDEKTPSFTVSQDKQFYHCFGCNANGTAITFLMEYNRIGFIEAIEELASRTGLEIPREVGYVTAEKGFTELYELMEIVARFYRQQLRSHPQAKRAVDYLKQRGISGEHAAEFELGYAPAGWDNLIKELGASDDAQKRLATAGMTIQRDNGGYYDRFRDRVMFPIRDQRGRMIGFGGRIIDGGTPKYLNSPETPIFHKGKELYGLYRARQKNKELERVYVVEGYMDVLALGQYEINNAVASLGTAATADHLERVFKLTPQLVFCFDGDEAGGKAALRAMETVLPLLKDGRQVFFKFLPDGEDPDDYVRKNGKEAFENQNDQLSLSDFMVNTAKGDSDLSTAEGSSLFMKNITPHLELLPDGVFKQFMLQHIEKLIGLTVGHIESKAIREQQARPKRQPPYRQETAGMTKISWLIALLLHKPELADLVEEPEKLTETNTPGADILQQLITVIQEAPGITTGQILERWRDSKFSKRLHELSSKEILNDEEIDLEREFLDARDSILNSIETHLGKVKKANLSDMSEELRNEARARWESGESQFKSKST